MQVIMLIFDTQKECIIINLPRPEFSNTVFLLAVIEGALFLGILILLAISMQFHQSLGKISADSEPIFQTFDSNSP